MPLPHSDTAKGRTLGNGNSNIRHEMITKSPHPFSEIPPPGTRQRREGGDGFGAKQGMTHSHFCHHTEPTHVSYAVHYLSTTRQKGASRENRGERREEACSWGGCEGGGGGIQSGRKSHQSCRGGHMGWMYHLLIQHPENSLPDRVHIAAPAHPHVVGSPPWPPTSPTSMTTVCPGVQPDRAALHDV